MGVHFDEALLKDPYARPPYPHGPRGQLMHPETSLALHRARATELHAEAGAFHLAAVARRHRDLRARLGRVLVNVGLRLTAAPRTAAATPPACAACGTPTRASTAPSAAWSS